MTDTNAAVAEMLDRQRIWECLLRYTRGIDRLDRALTLEAFHPDALIDQGMFKGSREGFADWVLNYHRANQVLTQHSMTNYQCEIDGDVAHAETYVAYYGFNADGKDDFGVGRYIDRLERRNGSWAISQRVCVNEGAAKIAQNEAIAKFAPIPGSIARPRRDQDDPSYTRPLLIEAD